MPSIWVWDTAKGNSTIIAPRVCQGIQAAGEKAALRRHSDYYGRLKPSVFYGFLKGNSVFIKKCISAGVDWWFIDNGYFRPGHYDGYYLVGKNQLQPRFTPSAVVDPKRWEDLDIKIEPWRKSTSDGHVLICPPTPNISTFYKIDKWKWISDIFQKIKMAGLRRPIRLREKGASTPLSEDLRNCHCVITYNSKVAIEALLKGIPAIADMGIVKDWNGLSVENVGDPLTSHDRLALFQFAASCQFTLDEFSKGIAWRMARRILR